MFNNSTHNEYTYFFAVMISSALIITITPRILTVNEYTYLICILFSLHGIWIMSDLFLSVHKSVPERGFWASIARYLGILVGYSLNAILMFLFSLLLVWIGFLVSVKFFWFMVIGGVTWILGYYLAKLVPNISGLWRKSDDQISWYKEKE